MTIGARKTSMIAAQLVWNWQVL